MKEKSYMDLGYMPVVKPSRNLRRSGRWPADFSEPEEDLMISVDEVERLVEEVDTIRHPRVTATQTAATINRNADLSSFGEWVTYYNDITSTARRRP